MTETITRQTSARPPASGSVAHARRGQGARPARASAPMASLAFAWRALLKVKRVPEQLIEAIAIPVVFLLMFTYLFGGAVMRSTAGYLEYILPGTLVMAVLILTMYVGTAVHTDISKGVYDRFRSLPIWPLSPLTGTVIGEAGRHALAAAIVVGLGLAMGYRPDGGAGGVAGAVALVVVAALGLSWVWIVLGLKVRSPNTIMTLGTVVLWPLTMASNVFADPDTMPGWLQAFVDVNPVTHLVTAERDLLDGTATAPQVLWVLAAAAALAAVSVPLARRAYERL